MTPRCEEGKRDEQKDPFVLLFIPCTPNCWSIQFSKSGCSVAATEPRGKGVALTGSELLLTPGISGAHRTLLIRGSLDARPLRAVRLRRARRAYLMKPLIPMARQAAIATFHARASILLALFPLLVLLASYAESELGIRLRRTSRTRSKTMSGIC